MENKIKELRKSQKMTQQELADKAGVNRLTIVAFEQGTRVNTTTNTMLKIANALGVTVDEIFFETSV